jgi:8-oxo-dGTP pyrophosphatase MutT (NUDIX family)
MTVTRQQITATIDRYLDLYPADRAELDPLLTALENDCADLSSRAALPGHVTCGAAVIDDCGRVLMIRHKVLGKWLLPGGHLDPGDTGLVDGAFRELEEETGIARQKLAGAPAADAFPIDVDVHTVPANPAKGEAAHWHADFRYAFRVTAAEVRLQLEEVTAHAWRPPADLQTPRLIARVGLLAA